MIRALAAAYTALAAGIAGVAAQDQAIRTWGYNPDAVYGVFDLIGVIVGAAVVASAATARSKDHPDFVYD